MDMEMTQVAVLKNSLTTDERLQFDVQFGGQRKNPTTALIIGLFLGYLGIDRFYLGQTGLGFFKLVTFGGVLIWMFIDWFLIMGAAKRCNIEIAQQIQSTLVQMRPEGELTTATATAG